MKKLLWRSWTGICASVMAAQTFLLFGAGRMDGTFVAFVGLATAFLYNLTPNRSEYRLFSLLCGALALMLWLRSGWPIWPGSIAAALVAMAYFLPKNRFALREWTFLKPIAVAVVWAILSIKMPLKVLGEPFVFALFAERFFFVAALAIGWDIADEPIDRKLGLLTLPVRAGSRAAKQIALGLLFFSAASAGWLSFRGGHSWLEGAVIIGSLSVTALFFRGKTIERMEVETAKLALDAAMIVQFLAIATAMGIGSKKKLFEFFLF